MYLNVNTSTIHSKRSDINIGHLLIITLLVGYQTICTRVTDLIATVSPSVNTFHPSNSTVFYISTSNNQARSTSITTQMQISITYCLRLFKTPTYSIPRTQWLSKKKHNTWPHFPYMWQVCQDQSQNDWVQWKIRGNQMVPQDTYPHNLQSN